IGGNLTANVAAGDDSISFTAQTITTADGATVTIGTNGSYTYTPNGSTVFETLSFGNTMTDSFTYTVTNSHAQSTTGTVSVTVSQPDHAATAVNDSYTFAENTTLNVTTANGVLANDTGMDADGVTAALVSGVSHGSLT